MGKTEEVDILIKARDQASGIIGGIKKDLLGIGLAVVSWNAIKDGIVSVINAGREAEAVWNTLSNAIVRHGGSWTMAEPKVKAFTASMQHATGVSDELIARGMQRLINYGMDVDQAMQTMTVAVDASAATQRDLIDVTETLGKASVGVERGLMQYGIRIDENIPKSQRFNEALRLMGERYAGEATSQLNTLDGQIKRLGESWGDFQEWMYEGAEAGSALGAVVGGLNAVLEGLPRFMEAAGEAFARWGVLVVTNVESIGAILRDFGLLFASALNPFEGDITEAWDQFKGTVGGAIDTFKAGVSGAFEASANAARTFADLHNAILLETALGSMATTATVKEQTKASLQEMYDWDAAKRVAMQANVAQEANLRAIRLQQEEQAWWDHETAEVEADTWKTEQLMENLNEHLDQVIEANEAAEIEQSLIAFKAMRKRLGYCQEEASAYQKMIDRMGGIVENWVDETSDALVEGRFKAADIFEGMAKDFAKLFCESALMALAGFVGKALGLLGLFDKPENDRMAAQMGRDYVHYFQQGALAQLGQANLAGNLAMGVSGGGISSGGGSTVVINFNGPVTDTAFVRTHLIPAIDSALNKRQGSITLPATGGLGLVY